ncbi:3'-5' exonuclease, putative [Bodo saltans]|uniref:3'-5' exonuclease, putative n=1 Tax=Bodo saltans TaxID=75058 RepID=A0A0S4JE65_BODSA|nr:3'-5' exonuclease, putative [Bodo saltans]|eukprot:CUG88580.1 3'-5' exonuclease, putative [Bodo saltans]
MVAFLKPFHFRPPAHLRRSSRECPRSVVNCERHRRASRIPSIMKPRICTFTSRISTARSVVFVVSSRAMWECVKSVWMSWTTKKREATDAPRIVGLDCEFTRRSPLTVIQIGDADVTFVFQVRVCGQLWLPNEVRSFLENNETVKCGVNVIVDVRLIHRELNIKVAGAFDIDCAAVDFHVGSRGKYCGLKTLCEVFLRVTLNKEQQTSDWAARRLSFEQGAYAANDTITSALIGQQMRHRGGDVQRWLRDAEQRLNKPTKQERKAAKQAEPSSVAKASKAKTSKGTTKDNEVLCVFYDRHKIESVSRYYATHKLKNCCIAPQVNADGTTEDIVILHEPPTRRQTPCNRPDGKCEVGDSCPYIHKNRIAAQERYAEWERRFAALDPSSTCIACGTLLLESHTTPTTQIEPAIVL